MRNSKNKQSLGNLLRNTWRLNFDDFNPFDRNDKNSSTSSDEHIEVIDNFIKNLLTSLDNKDLSILQKENSVLKHIEENKEPVLNKLLHHKSVQIRSKESLYTILYKRIVEIIDIVLFPVIEEYLKTIDFTFLSKCDRAKVKFSSPMDSYFTFIKRILKRKSVRLKFSSVFNCMHGGFIDKYVSSALVEKGYFYSEIRKSKLKKWQDQEIFNLAKAVILSHSAFLLSTSNKDSGINKNRIDQTTMLLRNKYIAFPFNFFSYCLSINLPYDEQINVNPVSRLCAILLKRSEDFIQYKKIDKGACSPDLSWFRVAYRNNKYKKLDPSMLEECILIATENNW